LEPVGWKLHAVEAEDTDTVESTKRTPAACGLRARHGWTVDLYIPEGEREGNRCKRCVSALSKRKLTGKQIDAIVREVCSPDWGDR